VNFNKQRQLIQEYPVQIQGKPHRVWIDQQFLAEKLTPFVGGQGFEIGFQVTLESSGWYTRERVTNRPQIGLKPFGYQKKLRKELDELRKDLTENLVHEVRHLMQEASDPEGFKRGLWRVFLSRCLMPLTFLLDVLVSCRAVAMYWGDLFVKGLSVLWPMLGTLLLFYLIVFSFSSFFYWFVYRMNSIDLDATRYAREYWEEWLPAIRIEAV